MNMPAFRPRAVSSRTDVIAFFAAFLLGILFYWILKSFDAAQAFITAALIAIMALYAAGATFVPQLKVRLDQAGDNAYYLGLLFTLVSMAFALYEFSGAQTGPDAATSSAKQIIGNFGIALGTTIAGIFLRVVLHQMRIDPADVEQMTRLELSEASSKVRATLEALSIDTARLLDEMQQRATDQVQRSIEVGAKALTELASRAADSIAQLSENTAAAHNDALGHTGELTRQLIQLGSEVQAAVQYFKHLAPPPANLAATLNDVARALKDVASHAEDTSLKLRGAAEQSDHVNEQLTAVSVSISAESQASVRRVAALVESVTDGIVELKKNLTDTGDILSTDRELLRSVSVESAAAVRSMQDTEEAAAKVLGTLTELAKHLIELLETDRRVEMNAGR